VRAFCAPTVERLDLKRAIGILCRHWWTGAQRPRPHRRCERPCHSAVLNPFGPKIGASNGGGPVAEFTGELRLQRVVGFAPLRRHRTMPELCGEIATIR
jgi:hypothetical protein